MAICAKKVSISRCCESPSSPLCHSTTSDMCMISEIKERQKAEELAQAECISSGGAGGGIVCGDSSKTLEGDVPRDVTRGSETNIRLALPRTPIEVPTGAVRCGFLDCTYVYASGSSRLDAINHLKTHYEESKRCQWHEEDGHGQLTRCIRKTEYRNQRSHAIHVCDHHIRFWRVACAYGCGETERDGWVISRHMLTCPKKPRR